MRNFRTVPMLVLTLLLLAMQLGSAFAHASLNGTTPTDGSMVDAAPSSFALVFSEPVAPLSLSLIRPDGSSTALENFQLQNNTLEIEAPKQMGRGTHVLAWRVVSSDGHPIGGSVIFSIGEVSAQAPTTTEAVDRTVRFGVWLSKVALYIGLFLGVGGVFARTILMPGVTAGSSALGVVLITGFLGTVLSMSFQGLDALGAPAERFGDAAVWQAGYSTTFGMTVVVATCALFAAGAALVLNGRGAQAVATLALVIGAGSLALSGHASAASPQWIMRPAVFLHAITIAVWTGALMPLGLALRGRDPAAVQALIRFSRIIPIFVAALAAAGVVLAIVQVVDPAALLNTAYGNVLLIKLLLLVLLFLLAAMNRWWFTRAAEAGQPAATRRMVRSIAAETLVVFLIFGVAATWRFTPPPRALAAAAARPATLHVHGATAMADLTVSPGRAGEVAVSAIVMTGDFGPLDAKEVTFVFSNVDAGIEPFRRRAVKSGDGTWRAEGVVLPFAGAWSVRLDILINDFEIARLEGKIDIRP